MTLLTDTAIRAEDLDEAAAVAAQKRAEEMLSHQKSKLEYAQAASELAQAAAQIRAIRKFKDRVSR